MYRKNTAGQFIHVQGVDSSTGGIKSGVSWTVRRCLDGTFAAATGTVTEDGTTGWYKFALSQADTNGNNCAFNFTGTGAIPQTVNFVTTACDPTSTAFGLSLAKTTNITGFNDIAATAVVSSGAITTSGGAVSTVTTVNGFAANAITAAAINADAITAAKVAADVSEEIADAVWDELLTGATHNIATSAGRRLRGVQDNQAYDGGAIWIDTVNGTAGTTTYENGTAGFPVDTLADALTLAAAANIKHLHIVNGSTITLAATMDNYELTGDEWGIALGAQSCNGLSIHNAHLAGVGVSGTFSGNPHLLHSTIGAITGPNARIGWCALTGTVTSNGTGTWVLHSCWGLAGAQFDFGAGGAQTIYITDWVGGPITIANMATGDVLYFEGRAATLTLAASCTGGTVYFAGDIALTNNGSGQTINQSSRYELTRLLSDSTAFQGANIDATISSRATPAQVNTEVLDVLNTDTFAEPGQAAPGATISLAAKIGYLYKNWRNRKTQTATEWALYADNATTVDQKATVSDDSTTAEKGEIATGP